MADFLVMRTNKTNQLPLLPPPAFSGIPLSRTVHPPESVLEKNELHQLQAFLRQSYSCPALRVTLHPKNPDMASVALGERVIGTIAVDDEDGDRSFAFEMKVPVERPALQEYLRLLFENDKLKINARAKKMDSVELLNGAEFLGIVSADDAKAKSYTLQMAILDYDLEEMEG